MVKFDQEKTPKILSFKEKSFSINENNKNVKEKSEFTKIAKNYFNDNTLTETKTKNNYGDNKFYVSQKINKGPWTPYEDEQLIKYIQKFGAKNWNECSEFIKNRNGKQCREHWKNCLNPDIKKGEWTSEEDLLIMILYQRCNGSWRELIHFFKDRTENSIKNRFFSELRKIASNDTTNKEKKRSSKIGLKNLMKYLEQGIQEAKINFMKENDMTEDELNAYLKKIEIKILSKKKEKKKKKLNILEQRKNNENKNILLGKKREKKQTSIKKTKVKKEKKIEEEKIINIENNQNNNIKPDLNEQNINKKNEEKSSNEKIYALPYFNDIKLNESDEININDTYNFFDTNNQNNLIDSSFIQYDSNDEKEERINENTDKTIQGTDTEETDFFNIRRSNSDFLSKYISNSSKFSLLSNNNLFFLGKR